MGAGGEEKNVGRWGRGEEGWELGNRGEEGWEMEERRRRLRAGGEEGWELVERKRRLGARGERRQLGAGGDQKRIEN